MMICKYSETYLLKTDTVLLILEGFKGSFCGFYFIFETDLLLLDKVSLFTRQETTCHLRRNYP